MVGVAAFELGHAAATLLILRATQLFEPILGQQSATEQALALYVGFNLAATVASFPAGRLGDRSGALPIFGAGVFLFMLTYMGFSLGPTNLPLLALCFAGGGLAIGCVETAQHAAVASLAPEQVRGSAFGLLAGIQGFGNLAASGIAGVLWTALGPSVAFGYLAVCCLAALPAIGLAAFRAR